MSILIVIPYYEDSRCLQPTLENCSGDSALRSLDSEWNCSSCLMWQPEKGFWSLLSGQEWSWYNLSTSLSMGKMASEKRLSLGLASVTRWPVMRLRAGSHLGRLLPGKKVNPGFVAKSTVWHVKNCGELDWSKHFVFPFLSTLSDSHQTSGKSCI